MNSTHPDVLPNVSAHTGGHHTAQALAQAYNVSDSTIRNRWFSWLKKVAPESLLKTKQGYTDLARTLFDEFAQVETCDSPKERLRQRNAWVTEAKARYSQEWGSVGVVDGELMPDSVSSALALRQTQTGKLQQSTDRELAELDTFLNQLAVTESDFSAAEVAAFKASGQRRGMLRFKIETQAELDTYSLLKQRQVQKSSHV